MEDNCIRFDWAAKRDGRIEGLAEGKAEGLAEGHEKGLAEGREKTLSEIAQKLKAAGMAQENINELLNSNI